MVNIQLPRLKTFMAALLRGAGMNEKNAETMTDVMMRATLRGVGHHDVHDLPGRVKSYLSGRINPNPEIRLISGFQALERYDGDNGPGELCCSFIMDRAEQMADEHGIALCTIQNSNHFLSAAPYVEKAAEKGYLAIIYTRTNPAMNVLGASPRIIGSSPMGFAAQTNEEYPIMLDICLAYASYGKFQEMADAGEEVPSYWGTDAGIRPTTDPAAIKNGGQAAPIGQHKGMGLSMLTEILTGVLSGGQIIDEKKSETSKGVGVYSQTAIVIKADGLMTSEAFKSRTSDVAKRMKALTPTTHIPGQASYEKKKAMEKDGYARLDPELVESLNALAEKLGIDVL